jgi:alkylation response protein AidB-like acyl-CoA dehydrogenase
VTQVKIAFTVEDEQFRERARDWLQANVPKGRPELPAQARRDFDLQWQRAQFEGGWAGIFWPKEHGGLGLTIIQQLIWLEEYARAGGPYLGTCFVGLSHAGPTLIQRGTEEQKGFHLPRILRGETAWCQGFSEPGAGSDLASLRTRADIDGDRLVVNGQKIWTSNADITDYQELLVRTDPSAPKHKGITWVICDMKAPGITVRPIKTMSGIYHFCEVFYDNVRIPLSNIVGEINDGWHVAQSTLSFERGTAFIPAQMDLAEAVERLAQLAATVKGPDGHKLAIQDDEIVRRIGTLRAAVLAMRAMAYTTVSRVLRQGSPGPEGSMMRLYYGELLQQVCRLAVDLIGTDSLALDPTIDSWTRRYLHSFKDTISAGTAQIQRNIIGERVLGLPRTGKTKLA